MMSSAASIDGQDRAAIANTVTGSGVQTLWMPKRLDCLRQIAVFLSVARFCDFTYATQHLGNSEVNVTNQVALY